MLMIRLQRLGRAHDPSYRLVVTEKASGPRAGKFVEDIGHYDARAEKGKDLQMNVERVKYWLSVGAQPSGTAHNLLVREGVLKGKKVDVRPAKIVKKPEVVTEPAKPKPVVAEQAKAEVQEAPVVEVAEEPVVPSEASVDVVEETPA